MSGARYKTVKYEISRLNSVEEKIRMDAVYGGDSIARSPAMEWKETMSRRFQQYLDKSTTHPLLRWILLAAVAGLFSFRIYYVQGFYVVAYTVGIYVINLLIAFLSPQVDPEVEGAGLPTKGSDEFKPFIRRLPEFKFWYSLMKAFLIAFVLTFMSIFDLPVFWPILLLYWLVLFVLTMQKQIKHMIKYKYIPFSVGKQRYTGKKTPSANSVFSKD